MARAHRAPDLDLYCAVVQRWVPGTDCGPYKKHLERFQAVLSWKIVQEPIRYLMDEKKHLRLGSGLYYTGLEARLPVAATNRRSKDTPSARTDSRRRLWHTDCEFLDLFKREAGSAHV